ncbi:MAG: hypothetical protein C5B47_05810 [Verrucomicrobia bacterium]|nr:MAG: hypothetical protein C5B47_05810 [Verrucomicrobiota bacterium]
MTISSSHLPLSASADSRNYPAVQQRPLSTLEKVTDPARNEIAEQKNSPQTALQDRVIPSARTQTTNDRSNEQRWVIQDRQKYLDVARQQAQNSEKSIRSYLQDKKTYVLTLFPDPIVSIQIAPKAKEALRRIDELKAKAAAENWAPWYLQYEIEKTYVLYNWEYWSQRWVAKWMDKTLEPMLKPVLENAINGLRVQRAGDKWEPWAIEHEIERLKEAHEWDLWGARLLRGNQPREPRLQRLTELKAKLQNKYNANVARELEERQRAIREKMLRQNSRLG